MGHIADVIMYEGDNSTFIWKHPCEDFNSLTQLIVHESQEAIFFMNGQALDLFGPGRYTLETQNIPQVGKLLNRTTGDSPFHCEVYFINKTVQMAIKWGTDSKVRFIDPLTGVPLDIGACGELNMQVSDSRKLLVKLVGTTSGIAWDDQRNFTRSVGASFRPLINTIIKSNLAQTIKNENIDILEIDEKLETLSQALRLKILGGFEEYGLTIPQFYVTTIVLPENDPNFKKIRDLHTISFQTRMIQAEKIIRTEKAQAEAEVTAAQREIELERQTTQTEVARREAEREIISAQAEAQKKKIEGFAEAEVMAAKGYTEKDVIQAEVQKAYAEGIGNMGGGSGGSSGIAGDLVGIMAGMKVAGMAVDNMGLFGINPMSSDAPAPKSVVKCSNCGNELPENAKFCLNCGTKVENLDANEIVCPSCGKKTPKGKFCMECGFSLINKCAKCGAEVPLGGKFCLECGEKL